MEVKALPNYRLWLRYDDGMEGEVDLSHLIGKGVFTAWQQEGFFDKVFIGPAGQIAWSDQIEVCSDSLYMKIADLSPAQLFPKLNDQAYA